MEVFFVFSYYMDIKRRDQIKKGKKDSVKESVKKRNQRKSHMKF